MTKIELSEMDIHLLKNMYDYVVESKEGLSVIQKNTNFNDRQLYDTLKSIKKKLKDENDK